MTVVIIFVVAFEFCQVVMGARRPGNGWSRSGGPSAKPHDALVTFGLGRLIAHVSQLTTVKVAVRRGRMWWTVSCAPPKLRHMVRFGLRRRLFTLAAAYFIALQALVLPMAAVAGAVVDVTTCYSASTNDARHPASQQTGCACAAGCGMQCCANTFMAPPLVSISTEFFSTAVELALSTLPPAADFPARRGHFARGPPSA